MRIPTNLCLPLLREYLESYETWHVPAGTNDKVSMWGPVRRATPKLGPVKILAGEAGIPYQKLRHIVNGRTQSVDPEDLDRLFCAMGRPDLWFEEPLASYYGETA